METQITYFTMQKKYTQSSQKKNPLKKKTQKPFKIDFHKSQENTAPEPS